MSHYRAVMATTIDCEGCKYDSRNECKADFCILFDHKPSNDSAEHDANYYINEILKRVKHE